MLSSTFKDKTRAARAVGSEAEVAVVKATNHDPVPPKRKHVATIKQEIADPNFKIATLFAYLEERFQSKSWTVVVKALMVTHELMRDPEPRVLKYVSQRPRLFNVSGYRDRCNVDSLSYVSLVDSYAIYLEERAICYQSIQLDFVNETFADTGRLRSADAARNVLRDVKALQELEAKLLKIKIGDVPSDSELVLELYRLLLKDALRLYETTQKGIVFLLEKFFKFEKEAATATLAIYRNSLEQTAQLNEFFQIGIKIGAVAESDVTALASPGSKLVETLQNHVATLNGGGQRSGPESDADLPPVQTLSIADTEKSAFASLSASNVSSNIASKGTGSSSAPSVASSKPAAAATASPWDDFESFTSNRQTSAPSLAPSSASPAGGFGAFGGPPAPAPAKPKAAEIDLFSFDEPAPAAPASTSAKDAVMSRFNAPPVQPSASPFFGASSATPVPMSGAPGAGPMYRPPIAYGGAAAPGMGYGGPAAPAMGYGASAVPGMAYGSVPAPGMGYGGGAPPGMGYPAPASTNPFGGAPGQPFGAQPTYGAWPAASNPAMASRATPQPTNPFASPTNPAARPASTNAQNPWGL